MNKCPHCDQTLPDWADYCQFCKNPIPRTQQKEKVFGHKFDQYDTGYKTYKTPAWVRPVYHIMACLLMLSGLWDIFFTIANQPEDGLGMMSFIGLTFSGVTVLMGLGLLLHIKIARTIVNFLCGINIIFGLIGLILNFAFMMASPYAGVAVLFSILDLFINGFMMYLIGETESEPWIGA